MKAFGRFSGQGPDSSLPFFSASLRLRGEILVFSSFAPFAVKAQTRDT
jgi:hypothetical protein